MASGSLESAAPTWWRIDRRGAGLRWRLVRLMPTASWRLSLLAGLVLLVTAVVPPLLMISVGRAVSAVQGAVVGGPGSAGAHRLLVALVAVGSLFALGQAANPLVGPLANQLGMRTRTVVFKRIMQVHLAPATIGHLEDPRLKDLVERAQDPGAIGTRQAVAGLVQRWATRLGSVGALVLLGTYRWWAGLLVTMAVVLAVRRMRIAHVEISRNLYRQSRTLRRSDYLRDLLLLPGAEKETRLFGAGGFLLHHLGEEWRAAMAPVWQRRRRSARDLALGMAPALAAVGLVDGLAVHSALGGAIGVGRLVVVLQAGFGALGAATVSVNDTYVELGIATLEAVEDLERGVALPGRPGGATRPADGMPRREIRFDGVRFTYPGTDREVLAGVDLVLPAGSSLAVVGANGAGKTTFVKLLTGLYEPTGGTVSVDGLPLAELEPRSWQRRSSAVFQDFVRYPWSAADNVALRSGADPAVLRRAAAAAGALELVESLPEGWGTVLSRQLGGVDLSGGQWQRIALARAFYAAETGASVLVLDEPTAHLDVRQEADFYERFLELTAGRTTIVVSHRFSTVRRADRIVVLERGRVAEAGSHDELVLLGGRYAALFALQADRFADPGPSGA